LLPKDRLRQGGTIKDRSSSVFCGVRSWSKKKLSKGEDSEHAQEETPKRKDTPTSIKNEFGGGQAVIS